MVKGRSEIRQWDFAEKGWLKFYLFLVTLYNLMPLIALSVNNVICFRSGGCDSKQYFNCLIDKRNSQSSRNMSRIWKECSLNHALGVNNTWGLLQYLRAVTYLTFCVHFGITASPVAPQYRPLSPQTFNDMSAFVNERSRRVRQSFGSGCLWCLSASNNQPPECRSAWATTTLSLQITHRNHKIRIPGWS